MSAWIPALHAGMTQSRSCTKTDVAPSTSRISTGELQQCLYARVGYCRTARNPGFGFIAPIFILKFRSNG